MQAGLLNDKCVLITGGTGSFGNEVVLRLLAGGCREVRIFSRDELKQETTISTSRGSASISATCATFACAAHLYVETPLRLPNCLSCYAPPATAPPVAPLPALKNGYATFGCFNQISKVTDEVIDLWAKILLSILDARLVMKTKGLKN